MKKLSFLIMMITLVLSAPRAFAAYLSSDDEAMLRAMPLRKKIGQMFIFGFQGKTLPESLGETIDTLGPGGIIVFSRNITSASQLAELLLQAQQHSLNSTKVPLLIGTDQEGGDVIRINTAMPLPSALALGKAGKPELTEAAGLATGQLLKTLGFNMNFAPVLDVADPTKPQFIGTRTFGSEPEVVAQMAVSFAKGLNQAGVLPTGKHFPGHGGVSADSHTSLAEKSASLEELREQDLVPFNALTTAFRSKSAMMLAHISYPSLDKSHAAATFSKPIVTNLLRNEMKFEGIVLTDDISMAGAGAIKSVKERALRTIEAGADMVMVAWNRRLQGELVAALEAAVRTGRIKQERIDASVRRILAAKRTYASVKTVRATQDELRLALKNPKFGEIGEETLRTRFARELEPAEIEFQSYAENKPVVLFSANARFAQSFKDAAQTHAVHSFALDVNNPYDVDKIMRANPKAVGVFYVSGVQAARVAAKIGEEAARRILLVTIEAPGSLKNSESFRYISDVYYRHPQLGKMIADQYFATETRQPASVKRRTKTVGLRSTDYSRPE